MVNPDTFNDDNNVVLLLNLVNPDTLKDDNKNNVNITNFYFKNVLKHITNLLHIKPLKKTLRKFECIQSMQKNTKQTSKKRTICFKVI